MLYEQQLGASLGTVFIIGPCAPPSRVLKKDALSLVSHKKMLETFKEAIRAEGLVPRFQEHEEPQKNIYLDIFDYIDICDFVIGDITWERPNCYLEIGYAIARGKPILLFVEESYFNTMMKGKVPFDLSPVKYQTYKRTTNGLVALRDRLNERIVILNPAPEYFTRDVTRDLETSCGGQSSHLQI